MQLCDRIYSFPLHSRQRMPLIWHRYRLGDAGDFLDGKVEKLFA